MKSLAVGIEELKATGKCLSDPKTLSYFAKDLSYHHPTIPLTVFIPENEKDVQRGLIICNHNGIKVTCTAGKTSLEGASIPGEETVVFDMSMVKS